MKQHLKLYEIDMKYVRDLAQVDDNVMSVSPQINKDMRPFVGILVLINGKEYCVPLSSPKPKFVKKKNTIDFMRIIDNTVIDEKGMGKIIGALNFNNMLPVNKEVIYHIDLRKKQVITERTKHIRNFLLNNWTGVKKTKINFFLTPIVHMILLQSILINLVTLFAAAAISKNLKRYLKST